MLGAPTGKVPAEEKMVSTLKFLHSSLKANLAKARAVYKLQADKRRQSKALLAPSDLLMVKAANFKLHLKSRKLGPRRIGPFKVVKQINEVAFQVELPQGSKMHPVFHRSQLRLFKGDAPYTLEPIYSSEPGEDLYEVESILATRMTRGKRHFLVKWRGYLIEEASWQSADE